MQINENEVPEDQIPHPDESGFGMTISFFCVLGGKQRRFA
jgi:hypothetical protein